MRLETGRVLLIYGTKSGEHKSDQTKPKRPHLTNIKWTPQSLTNANKKRGKRSIRASPMVHQNEKKHQKIRKIHF